MKYGLVKGSVIKNVIEADTSFIEHIRSEWDEIIEITDIDGPSIDWTKDVDGKFKNPVIPPVAVPNPVRERLKRVDLNGVASIAAIRPVLADIIELLKKG